MCKLLSAPRLCAPMMHLCCGALQTFFTGMRQNKVDRRRKLVNHSVGGCIEAKAVRLREGDYQETKGVGRTVPIVVPVLELVEARVYGET